MAIPTKTLTINVFEPGGTAVQGAIVKALLSGIDVYQSQFIYPIELTATTNASGVATIALFPNVLGERSTFYTVKAQSADGSKTYFNTTVLMPNEDKTLDEVANTHPPVIANPSWLNNIKNIPFVDQQSKYLSQIINFNTAPRVYVFPDVSGRVLISEGSEVALMPGRVPFVGAGGGLVDSADLTFDAGTVTLSAAKAAIAGLLTAASLTVSGAGTFSGTVAANAGLTASALTVSALTSGRIPFASAGGLLVDSANLRWSAANNQLLLGDGSAGAPAYSFASNSGTGLFWPSASVLGIATGGMEIARFSGATSTFQLSNALGFGWSDLLFMRDAANTLAQRNGTSGQTHNIYRTFTDALNYERVTLDSSTIPAVFREEFAGTGSARGLDIRFSPIRIGDPNVLYWRFSNHLIAITDNISDIGASGTSRPRTGYFGTSVVTPLVGSGGTGSIRFTTSGGEQFRIVHAASAVNFLQATGSATGIRAEISAQGSDAAIGIQYSVKGGSDHNFYTGGTGAPLSGVRQFLIGHVASAVNYLRADGAATGNPVTVSAQGSDANVDLALTPKGTGVLRFGTHTAIGAETVTGFITIKDSGGTSRKLAVVS